MRTFHSNLSLNIKCIIEKAFLSFYHMTYENCTFISFANELFTSNKNSLCFQQNSINDGRTQNCKCTLWYLLILRALHTIWFIVHKSLVQFYQFNSLQILLTNHNRDSIETDLEFVFIYLYITTSNRIIPITGWGTQIIIQLLFKSMYAPVHNSNLKSVLS